MILFLKDFFLIESERLYLRLPLRKDFENWVILRKKNEKFLNKWEPKKTDHFYSLRNFKLRVNWCKRNLKNKKSVSLLIFLKKDDVLIGGITMDNIRQGSSQSASLGYWLAEEFARNGYMTESMNKIIEYGFRDLKLSRLEAATLPENEPSRKLLEKVGFKYEGVAQSYLKIYGKWRNHIIYSKLREDRKGRK
tara:strand:- start:1232 stop:1810 length:579 start_codon:yes stop_codon:yes gene_type:complete